MSECLRCGDNPNRTVFKEGFYPCPSCNPESPEYQLAQLRTENEAKDKEIERLKEENHWIPISERLPEKTGEYLVLPYQQHCPVLWYQDGWYWYSYQDDAIQDTIGYCEEPIFEVTHWKPIIPT